VAEDMRRTSPKYIPREWMLVDCYTAGTTDGAPAAVLKKIFGFVLDADLDRPISRIISLLAKQ